MMTGREFLRLASNPGFALSAVRTAKGLCVVEAGQDSVDGRKPVAWLAVDDTGAVNVLLPGEAMGSSTSLPAVLAEEMDIPWERVTMVFGPMGESLLGHDQAWPDSPAGMEEIHQALRLLGAAAREMILAQAAQEWSVERDDLETRQGAVIHRKDGRAAGYAELAEPAGLQPAPSRPQVQRSRGFAARAEGLLGELVRPVAALVS
jgi:isoquinoline 1-oxidoreductase beta subunit